MKTGGRRRSTTHPPFQWWRGVGGQERTPPTIMRTHPHEQLSSHTPVTQPLTTLWSGHLSTQTSRLENNLSHFIFCTIPLHINRNWMSQLKWCLKANLFFLQIFTRLSQITKSEMGLLRFLFYVAMNEFPAEYLSIIFFETIFRGAAHPNMGESF